MPISTLTQESAKVKNPSGPPGSVSERRAVSVSQSKYPTQANNRLEWPPVPFFNAQSCCFEVLGRSEILAGCSAAGVATISGSLLRSITSSVFER